VGQWVCSGARRRGYRHLALAVGIAYVALRDRVEDYVEAVGVEELSTGPVTPAAVVVDVYCAICQDDSIN